jgi:hypothetical protein
MSQKTQGTNLYTIDPQSETVLKVGCVISIDGIDTTLDQLETTCLDSPARTYVAGLATPGTASFGINFDPKDASHVRLHQLKVAGTTLPWAVGFGDGTAEPTVGTDGNFELPATRSWIAFDGFMNSYPFTFALNAVVTSTVGIQISGEPEVIKKSA